MLEIINNLVPFFEDCYRRISVREYARLMKISPPTASKRLLLYGKEGLLLMERDRNYIFYYVNKSNKDFIDLSRIYWRLRLGDFIEFLEKNLVGPTIILFGSLSKAEVNENSDIDFCIIGSKKEIDVKKFESKLGRKIQLFFFKSLEDSENNELTNNILNGYVLSGRIRL